MFYKQNFYFFFLFTVNAMGREDKIKIKFPIFHFIFISVFEIMQGARS